MASINCLPGTGRTFSTGRYVVTTLLHPPVLLPPHIPPPLTRLEAHPRSQQKCSLCTSFGQTKWHCQRATSCLVQPGFKTGISHLVIWQPHGSRGKEILLFIILAWLYPTGSSLVLPGLVRNTSKPGLALCRSNFPPGFKFTHLLSTSRPMFPLWTIYPSLNLDSNSLG